MPAGESVNITAYSFENESGSINYYRGSSNNNLLIEKFSLSQEIEGAGVMCLMPSAKLLLNVIFSKDILTALIATALALFFISFLILAIYAYKKAVKPVKEFEKVILAVAKDSDKKIKFKKGSKQWRSAQSALELLRNKINDLKHSVNLFFGTSRAIVSKAELSEICVAVTDVVCDRFEDSFCAIAVSSERGTLAIEAQKRYSEKFASNDIKIESGNPLTDAFTMATRTVVKDLSQVDEKFSAVFTEEGAVAQINVPITDENGTSVGVLSVSSKTDNILNEDYAPVLDIAVQYLSTAFRNFKKFNDMFSQNKKLSAQIDVVSGELTQSNKKLVKKTRELLLLNKISSAIATTPDFKKTLGQIASVAKEALEADFSVIFLYDKINDKLAIQEGGVFTKDVGADSLDVLKDEKNSVVAKVFREGKTYKSGDVSNDSANAKRIGLKSMIVAPLACDKDIIGVLAIGGYSSDAYSEEDKNLIVMIATWSAMLIKNADLYDELATCRLII